MPDRGNCRPTLDAGARLRKLRELMIANQKKRGDTFPMIPKRSITRVERGGGGRAAEEGLRWCLQAALSDRRFCWSEQSLADIIQCILPTGKTGAEAANQIAGSGKHLGRPG